MSSNHPLLIHIHIAVWDKDLYTVSPEAVKDLDCQITRFEGEIVYRSETTTITVSGSGS